MILNSKQFRGSSTLKIHFMTFAWAFEKMDIIRQTFYINQKMRKNHFTSFDINVVVGCDRGKWYQMKN